MKLLPLLGLLLMSFSLTPYTITDSERKLAVDYLIETRDFVLKSVKGLTDEQLNFKSSPESWSIAECAEHIAITENGIFSWMESTLKDKSDPAKLAEVKMSNEDVIKMITDRSSKVKTNEAATPKNTFGSCEASMKEFKAKRDAHIARPRGCC